ncbi:MAG: SDR family oxidoreductase [Hyphomicrobiales bacterium]|nr:SDR family oxidoreductase [Hyphomicrobiales bacterium]
MKPPVALVTGTSSGIGAAICRTLLDQGFRVHGLDRAPAKLDHASFHPVAVELDDSDALRQAVAGIDSVDVLVHAAGFMRVATLGAGDMQAAASMWAVHVAAAMALAEHFAPAMRAGGRIVLIGSRTASGAAGRGAYAASKAALTGLARSWAKELAPRGITVNIVAPGATDTPMLADPQRGHVPPQKPPIGRFIAPEEVAALAAFLISPAASAITGQTILICGGASL